ATVAETPDDIRVGDLVLRDSLHELADAEDAERIFQQRGLRRAVPAMTATVRLSATEDGRGLPCRFTLVDAGTGALAFVGAESDDRIAVREGVVYALDGKAT